jgi:hypothetical protein
MVTAKCTQYIIIDTNSGDTLGNNLGCLLLGHRMVSKLRMTKWFIQLTNSEDPDLDI